MSDRPHARQSLPASPQQRLDEAWARLDRAFGPRQDRIGPVDACSHCFTEAEMHVLGGPVDEIPQDLLVHVAMDWFSTVEVSEPHWRRYTPCLLRGVIEGTLHMDESGLARNFNYSRWKQWPEDERRAIEHVCSTWWDLTLASDLKPSVIVPPAVRALTFLVPLTQELGSWLTAWSHTEGFAADLQLLALWEYWTPELLAGELTLAFSGEVPDISAELSAWLLTELPRRDLLGALDETHAHGFERLTLPPDQR